MAVLVSETERVLEQQSGVRRGCVKSVVDMPLFVFTDCDTRTNAQQVNCGLMFYSSDNLNRFRNSLTPATSNTNLDTRTAADELLFCADSLATGVGEEEEDEEADGELKDDQPGMSMGYEEEVEEEGSCSGNFERGCEEIEVEVDVIGNAKSELPLLTGCVAAAGCASLLRLNCSLASSTAATGSAVVAAVGACCCSQLSSAAVRCFCAADKNAADIGKRSTHDSEASSLNTPSASLLAHALRLASSVSIISPSTSSPAPPFINVGSLSASNDSRYLYMQRQTQPQQCRAVSTACDQCRLHACCRGLVGECVVLRVSAADSCLVSVGLSTPPSRRQSLLKS